MNACWHPDPEKRPQFKEIVKRIERAQKARIFDAQDREEATTFGNKGMTFSPPFSYMCPDLPLFCSRSTNRAERARSGPADRPRHLVQVRSTKSSASGTEATNRLPDAVLFPRVHKALWKAKNQNVALKTFHCPDLVPEELADFKRELWLTR